MDSRYLNEEGHLRNWGNVNGTFFQHFRVHFVINGVAGTMDIRVLEMDSIDTANCFDKSESFKSVPSEVTAAILLANADYEESGSVTHEGVVYEWDCLGQQEPDGEGGWGEIYGTN